MKHICHNGTSLPGLVGHSIMAYWCIPGAVKDTQELAQCESRYRSFQSNNTLYFYYLFTHMAINTLALCTQTHSFLLLLTEDT